MVDVSASDVARPGPFESVLMLVTSDLVSDPRVVKEARSLAGRGVRVRVVAAVDSENEGGQRQFAESEPYEVAYVGSGPRLGRTGIDRILARLRMFAGFWREAVRREGALLHCHDLDAALVGWALNIVRGREYVYDAHEVWLGRVGVAGTWWSKPMGIVERSVLRRARSVISVASSAASYFSARASGTPVYVATNSVDPMPSGQPLPRRPFLVMYQGRFTPERGLDEFLEAAKLLPKDVRVVLRGFGALEQGLRAKAESIENVEFWPQVPMERRFEALSDCHVGVVLTELTCLNHELTVSNKLYEYAAAGRPMILSKAREHVLLNDEYEFAEIVDVDPEAIAAAIMRLAEDPDRYSRFRHGAEQLAEARRWSLEVNQIIAAYALAPPTSVAPKAVQPAGQSPF